MITNIDESVFDKENFSKVLEHYKEVHGVEASIPITYLHLYIASINKVKFSFTKIDNSKFYPDFTLVAPSKYVANQREMNSGIYIKYGDGYNSSYYNLQPYEMMFVGNKTNHTTPLWAFGACFFLPYGSTILHSLEVKEVIKEFSAPGENKTPSIRLREIYDDNGTIRTRDVINENMPTNNTAYKKIIINPLIP